MPDSLTYSGPTQLALNAKTVLGGSYDPNKITRVTFVAEDLYPLPIGLDTAKREWGVELIEGFNTPGNRWFRLKGMGADGKIVQQKIVKITVSRAASGTSSPAAPDDDDTTTSGQLRLKILQNTFFKASPSDSGSLNAAQKIMVRAGQTFNVKRYGFVDGHIKAELGQEIAPVGNFGYCYAKHVVLKKGQQVLYFDISDVPNMMPGTGEMLVVQNTLLKAELEDSANLGPNEKVQLTQGQTFATLGYACVGGHFRVSFLKEIPGFGTSGYVYWQHIKLKKDGKLIDYNPDAVTVKLKQSAWIKKRPVSDGELSAKEKKQLQADAVYGVVKYTPAKDHVKLSLTENLLGFGNTGYIHKNFVQLQRGGKPFPLTPSKIELNVPYFSQRDNPRVSWATCNVTSIAMVMHYHGIRSKSGGQLEDELLQWCYNNYSGVSSPQTDNGILVELVQAYGFDGEFTTTRSWAQVKNELNNGRPVVVGGLFTHSGHIVCIIGYTPKGYIVNDPWGDATTGYGNTEGNRVFYPNGYMSKMCCPEGDGNIWAHFIKKKG